MSDTYRPITLESLAGQTPNAAAPPRGAFANFLTSMGRSGTSELVGLEGAWLQGLGGVSSEENDAWRQRNFAGSIASQIAGALPAYVASAYAAGPVAAATGLSRLFPAVGRLFDPATRAATLAANPVRATALEAAVATLPISGARLALTPVLGGDLERTAASVGIDLAGSALMGAGFGVFRGLRTSALADDYERLVAQRIDGYNRDAPVQERIALLEGFAPNDADMAQIATRTLEGLRQTVRTETAPSMLGNRNWLGPMEGEESASPATLRAVRTDLNRLFRPTPATTEAGTERALQVQTLTRSSQGFPDAASWQRVVEEVGLPAQWERNIQYPRVVTARGSEVPRVEANITRHLGEDLGDGWRLRREANQDLFVVARRLPAASDGGARWFVARTNAPERLLPQLGALRRGDKLARFIGQAEENLLARATARLPEDDILRMAVEGQKFRPPGLRAEKPNFSLVEHFPRPLADAAKELQPLAQEISRRVRGVVAPTLHRFNDRPLIKWVLNQARSVYESAQGKAARALHGTRPGLRPLTQVVRGLPDEGGLRKTFDAMTDADVSAVVRYRDIRESGKLGFDEALTKLAAEIDGGTLKRIEPFLRTWDRVATDAWDELVRTAAATGTKIPKEVEGWAFPHTWVGDWRHRVYLDDRSTHIVGGRTREEARRAAEDFARQNGGRLDGRGPFQTDRDGDYELLRERGAKRLRPETVGVSQFSHAQTRRAIPAGGYVGHQQVPTKAELWDILSSDITLKYRDIAQRSVKRTMEDALLPEIRSKYGLRSMNEAVQQLNIMRGQQGEFSRWQNQAMSFLDPLLGKNSASRIAAAVNATEAHFAFGFGNLSFPAGNAVTFLQTVAPKIALFRDLGMKMPERAWAYMDFMPTLGPGGLPTGGFAALNPLKLAKESLRSLWNPTELERKFFNRAVEEGVIASRIKDEYLGQSARFRQSLRDAARGEEPIANVFRAGATANMALPHRVEELTRAQAFFTWMRAGEMLNMTDDALYEFAKRGTWATMYGYAQADRPALFRGPVGMMAGLFKNWLFNYTGDLIRYAGEATRGNYNGLLWALGGVGATAGLGGLPLWHAVDQFQRIFNDKTMAEELYSATGTEAGDALYYGVPGLLGVSLQGMMAAPFNDPRRDITFLTNAVTAQRVQKLWQVGGDVMTRWGAGGENPFTQDRTWDQVAYALAPRTLYRLMAQVEDGAMKSIRNGRPIIEGVSEAERWSNAFGMTPARLARAWELSESLWSDQERRRRLTTGFAETYSDAMTAGDSRAMQNVIERAIESGVDLSSVVRGAMMRQRNLMQPQIPFDYLRQPGAYERMRAFGLME